MSLKLKVFLAVIVACTGLSLAVIEIVIVELAAARALVADVSLPRNVSAVIHEMQIERGGASGSFRPTARPRPAPA